MIELVFVIVIIGILAAIAIPKLSSTRDDAEISKIIANAKVALIDLQKYYTAVGNAKWKAESINKATSIPFQTSCGTLVDASADLSPNTFVLCSDNVVCLSFETIDEGNLTITDGAVTTSIICEAVKSDPAITGISNKTYRLGGETVVR